MKWKDFKNCVESEGVNDDTEISYIDSELDPPEIIFLKDRNYAYID